MATPKGGRESEQYSKKETARRLEAIMRGAFSGPPKTYEESKLGKPKGKPSKSLGKRKFVEKRGPFGNPSG
jgi:hypothetical protein